MFCGAVPHSDYASWEDFIGRRCEPRGEADGVVFYGATNCNFIVFPCGTLVRNYGYHGRVLMDRIRQDGAAATLDRLRWRGSINFGIFPGNRSSWRFSAPTRACIP